MLRKSVFRQAKRRSAAQIGTLRQLYPDRELLSDIGSGLNFKRRHFVALLEQILRGAVQEVCVLHKDRLCRFGYELVELICQHTGTKLIVVHHNNNRTETEDTTSCPKTFYQLLQSLWRDITGNAQLGTEERVSRFKTRRIRLCPTKAQKQTLIDWKEETVKKAWPNQSVSSDCR